MYDKNVLLMAFFETREHTKISEFI